MKKPALFAIAAATLLGCNNDLDVNAPYQNITIVYGLLSKTTRFHDPATGLIIPEDTHYVKINKAFLGEGDAFLFALNPDSNEFQEGEMTAIVVELNAGVPIDSFDLVPTLITNRDIGVFYAPEQTVYYFVATLDQDHEYRIVVNAKGETITATTPIVDDFTISPGDASLTNGIQFIVAAGYADWELNWTSSSDGRAYEAQYRFNYAEVEDDGDTIHKSFTRYMGKMVAENLEGGQQMNATIPGEDFYKGVRNLIPDRPGVVKRIFKSIDLLMAVASDDFHTYLSLSDPITGIVEERPDFTNVNGGYGLFGGRYFKQVIGKKLKDEALFELLEGQYTADMLWCAAQSVGPPYGCTP